MLGEDRLRGGADGQLAPGETARLGGGLGQLGHPEV